MVLDVMLLPVTNEDRVVKGLRAYRLTVWDLNTAAGIKTEAQSLYLHSSDVKSEGAAAVPVLNV